MNTPANSQAETPAQLAKAALRRLAQDRLEPTPENFARAYHGEAGSTPVAPPPAASAVSADGEAWALLFERAMRGLERGGRQWTTARKKDSLQRVLGGSRSDARRLQQRLSQLITSWDTDTPDEAPTDLAPLDLPPAGGDSAASPLQAIDPPLLLAAGAWPRVASDLGATVRAALSDSEPRSREVAALLTALQSRLELEGPDPVADEVGWVCAEAQRVLQHRHHLMSELGRLCEDLTDSLTDLAEDDSWAQGQCVVMRSELIDSQTGITARGVRAVGELLRGTRHRQQQLKTERNVARQALKASIHEMLEEIAALGARTGSFTDSMGHYAEAIDKADSLESLAGTVRELVAESRAVHQDVSERHGRLVANHERAGAMQARVNALEDEIRRLSSEVSTDPLTQIANRRGLAQAFEIERARSERAAIDRAPPLAVGLIDIDNFKRLNDRLGHANGDAALKFLTERVSQALRPGDTLARYGGEEFVVLLPTTQTDEAQRVLTRLQRKLSAELFMSDAEGQVFVTFSAGVTPYRPGERLEQALERADEALYEAKRTGKNKTCVV